MALNTEQGVQLDRQLRSRLCGALASFQGADDADEAALVQMWLSKTDENGVVLLSTKGLPYAVAGVGDLLALFRCISCKYTFSTTTDVPDLLGAPGRVFATGEPEFLADVQQCSKAVYMRVDEATQCAIRSVLLLPLFADPGRTTVAGVLEIAQASSSMPFTNMVQVLGDAFKPCGLYLCSAAAIQSEMQMAAIMNIAALKLCCKEAKDEPCPAAAQPGLGRAAEVPLSPGAMNEAAVDNKKDCKPTRSATGSAAASDRQRPAAHESAAATRKRTDVESEDAMPSGDSGDGSGDARRKGSAGKNGAKSQQSASAPKRRAGTKGKPGKALTLENLQAVFGLSLQDAAAALGICATTLKRACRRHGIRRWPRQPHANGDSAEDPAVVWENSFLATEELASAGAPFPPPLSGSSWFGRPPAAPCVFPAAGSGAAPVESSSLIGLLPPPQFWSTEHSVGKGAAEQQQSRTSSTSSCHFLQTDNIRQRQGQLTGLQQEYHERWFVWPQQQWARQDAERQQHERERERQATRLQAERATLRAQLEAQKAMQSEPMTAEQLRQQHDERWGWRQSEGAAAERRGGHTEPMSVAGPLGAATPVFMSIDHPVTAPELQVTGLSDGAPRACSMSGFDADDVFEVGELSSPDVVFTDGDPLHFLSFDSVVPQPTRA